MYQFIKDFNYIIFLLFFFCYFYQAVFVAIRFFKKPKSKDASILHQYAVVISARNEKMVIGELIDSINNQNYPKDKFDIYVIADNCTDNTAQIARERGAIVYERFNTDFVGKGYSLDFAFNNIEESVGMLSYDGYFIFDADNVLDENYLLEMNKVFDQGYNVVTGYRNSKNYDSNWISAGYGLWFMRESRFLNGSRMICKTSCTVSGTGFLVASKLLKENEGWKYHLLTEDIEFSTDRIIHGEVIGYCEDAVLYDEQPTRFKDSWNQRLRWTKGFYQVFFRYGKQLFKGIFKKKGFQCFDMMMVIAPATILSVITALGNGSVLVYGFLANRPGIVEMALIELLMTLAGIYFSLFMFGTLTTVTEWKRIHCRSSKKIIYLFSFPVFMLTYVPIGVVAMFKKVTWTPINHSIIKSVQQIRQ